MVANRKKAVKVLILTSLFLLFQPFTLAQEISAVDKVKAMEAAMTLAKLNLIKSAKGVEVKGFNAVLDVVDPIKVQTLMQRGFIKGYKVLGQGCDKDGLAWAVVSIKLNDLVKNTQEIQMALNITGSKPEEFRQLIETLKTEPREITAIGISAVKNIPIDPTIKPDTRFGENSLLVMVRKAMANIKKPCTTEGFVKALFNAEVSAYNELAGTILGNEGFQSAINSFELAPNQTFTLVNGAVEGAKIVDISADEDGVVSVTVERTIETTKQTLRRLLANIEGKNITDIAIDLKQTGTVTFTGTGYASAIKSKTSGGSESGGPVGEIK